MEAEGMDRSSNERGIWNSIRNGTVDKLKVGRKKTIDITS